MVTVGAVGLPKTTELSLEVEAALRLPAVSVAAPAGILATTVPVPDMPVTVTVYLVALIGVTMAVSPAPPPVLADRSTSLLESPNPVTPAENVTSKLIDRPLVGSTWPTAWLIVTAGPGATLVLNIKPT